MAKAKQSTNINITIAPFISFSLSFYLKTAGEQKPPHYY